ncbi:MAG: putative zinc-binding protein [bacterium]
MRARKPALEDLYSPLHRLHPDHHSRCLCVPAVGHHGDPHPAPHIQPMVQSARDVDRIVAIDGCDVCCARKLLEHLELPIHRHVVVTQLGVDKNYETRWPSECITRVKEALREPAPAFPASASSPEVKCCT